MGWKHRIELSKCVCSLNYIQKGKQNQLVCTQQHVYTFIFSFTHKSKESSVYSVYSQWANLIVRISLASGTVHIQWKETFWLLSVKKTIISFGLNTKKCDCGNGNARLLEKEREKRRTRWGRRNWNSLFIVVGTLHNFTRYV